MSDEGHGGLDGIEEAYEVSEFEQQEIVNTMLASYDLAKRTAVGAQVTCPVCLKPFVKMTKGQAFCRHRGPGNCKDRFWNTVNDERRERAVIMNR